MSAFYDQASLVVVPSGYKSQKVYAQKPLTTDGQLTFSRASTATRVNSAGLIETVSSNVPRLDYLGSSCPKILLEPQRSNLVTYSEEFDNAAWTKNGVTITANATTSPDGFTNADKIVADASSGNKVAFQVATVSSGVAYTASAYYKASEYNYAFMRLGGINDSPYVIYNLSTQALVASAAITSSSITSVGNGWYRITATATTTALVLAPNLMVIPSTGYTLDALNVPEFTGNGTSGGFVWGCQVEAGAYATSYIPTLGAAVTRGADACSKTGISSLIGQTEGTVFVDINFDNSTSSFQVGFAISDNAGPINKHVWLGRNNYNFLTAFLRNTSYYIQYSPSSGGITSNGRHKMAIAYASNSAALYIDGVQIATSSSVVVPTMNQAEFGLFAASIDQADSNINQALLFKTRLTNAQLAELTAL